MPLLSLPAELLNEIVRLAIQTPSPSPDSCRAPACPEIDESGPCPCTPPAATSLAHTCGVLRSHTFPLMYASLTVNLAHSLTLHAHLTAWPHIASCVRTLTLFITNKHGSQLLHGIIRRCTNLQNLQVDGSHTSGNITASLLIDASEQPLRSLTLRRFEWLEIWCYLCTAPDSLHTLRLEHPFRPLPIAIVANRGAPVVDPRLPQVHKFICHTALADQRGAQDAGGWLSRVVPNATVLDIHLSDITMQFLLSYAALGSRLTELTVHFLSAQPLFCGTVVKLAPALRRFIVHGGCVCEMLFAAEWRRVEVFDVACLGGCKGVRVGAVREALLRLVAARPRADVRVVVGGRELVRSDGTGAVVATLESFGVLEEVWQDY